MRSINLASILAVASLSALPVSCAGDSGAPAGAGTAVDSRAGNGTAGGGNDSAGGNGSGGVIGGAAGSGGTNLGGATGVETGGTSAGTAGMLAGGGGQITAGATTGGFPAGFGGAAGSPAGGTASGTGGATAPASGYPLKNPPVASAGCAKALATFKTGTHTYKITSAGLNREYIVNIPENYDPNTPHRVVFGMHCNPSTSGVSDRVAAGSRLG